MPSFSVFLIVLLSIAFDLRSSILDFEIALNLGSFSKFVCCFD